ncbi:CPBP family intramembrane metalloprotease domain-containing protein [Actinomyces naeslundii]|nr:CPBP family intramembrane metalloprotease domain-containing protein [Actinomyces naeslundii]
MSASHGKPRSVEVSSTLSSLESSDLSGYQSDQERRLTVSGKVLRIVIAVAMMFACALTPSLLSQIPAVRSFGIAHSHPQSNVDDVVMAALVLLLYGTATILVLMLCYVLRRTLDRGRRVSLNLRLDRRALLWAVGMVLVAVAVNLAVAGIVHALGLAGGNEGMPNRPWWFIAAAIFSQAFFLQGIPEEIIWRGWLFSSLGETRFAAVSSVLGFTVLHLLSQGGQQNLFEHLTYLALPCGFAVTALIVRMISGSTWAAIGVHGGIHVANDVLSDRLHLPSGSITWVLQGLLWAAVGLLILAFHRRRQRLAALTDRTC